MDDGHRRAADADVEVVAVGRSWRTSAVALSRRQHSFPCRDYLVLALDNVRGDKNALIEGGAFVVFGGGPSRSSSSRTRSATADGFITQYLVGLVGEEELASR